MAELSWLLVVAGGAALMGLVIAYALINRRRLTAPERARRDAKVDRLYEEETPEAERR